MTENLFLRPITPVYFGRPGAMSAGENNIGVSWFPPPVSAFQGMIRTRLLDGAGIFSPKERVAELVGSPDELPTGWQLQGPFPAQPAKNKKEMQVWLPCPAFLLQPVDNSATQPVIARSLPVKDDYLADAGAANPTNRHGRLLRHDRNRQMKTRLEQDNLSQSDFHISSNEPFLRLFGQPAIAGEKPIGGWLSSRNLYYSLAGKLNNWVPQQCTPDFPPFVEPENKTGLAREKKKEQGNNRPVITGRADEGKLYSLEYLRFAPFTGLVGWFNGTLSKPLSLDSLASGTVIAGKKGGMIGFEPPGGTDPWWEKIAAGEHLQPFDNKTSGENVWIILLSPGKWENITELEDILKAATGYRATLNGCVCPPVTWLGGFSLAKRQPRPATGWYSPGTSLNISFDCDDRQQLLATLKNSLNNRCLLAPRSQRPFGYGHILVSTFLDNGVESYE